MLEIGLYHFHSKIISFGISPLTYNGGGHVTDLTPGDPSEKSEIYKMLVLGGLTGFRKFHLPAANVVTLTALRNRATF